jgi:hypothetical protein
VQNLYNNRGIVRKLCFLLGLPRSSITGRTEGVCKVVEKRWQLEQRIGVRVPEVADDGGVERVELRVESPAVKRSVYVCYRSGIFGVCDSLRLL